MELKTNTQNSSNKTFLRIMSSDGKFHQKVNEETPGAVANTYKKDVKDDKGKIIGEEDAVSYDLVYKEVTGMITNMYFSKGNFGENLIVDIDDDGSIVLSTNQAFAEQLLRKLPNIDLSKPVTLAPYPSFIKNGNQVKKGLTVIQDGERLKDYYFDYETKKALNGMPEAEKESDGSTDWTMYFMIANKFLKKQSQPIFEVNGFKAPEVKEDSATVKVETGEVAGEDLPDDF